MTFRFLLRPHGPSDPAEASRLAIGLATPGDSVPERYPAEARASTPDVLQRGPDNGLETQRRRPGLDGSAFRGSRPDCQDDPGLTRPAPEKLWRSDTSEKPGRRLSGPVEVPAYGVVTLRAEWRP